MTLEDMRRELRRRYERLRRGQRRTAYVEFETFEELKKSGWFDYPGEYINPGIREFCRKINELPYAATYGSCAGHTDEEWLAKAFIPPPPEENHAYVSVYVPNNRRREFYRWLKEQVDMDEVNVHMEPVGFSKLFDPFLGGSRIERWEPTMGAARTKEKVFSVHITSKKLHMPLRR